MYFLACRPSSVPPETLARKMSPVEIFGIAKCSAMNSAWVPLPAPGGPTRTNLMSPPSRLAQETFVVALHELAFDLLHRIEAHAHHDQHRGTAEREVLRVTAGDGEEEVGQHGDDAQVQRARQGDARQDELQVLGGRA